MLNDPAVIPHGGKEGKIGSCHELCAGPDAGILIDCGMFQGDEKRGMRVRSAKGFFIVSRPA